MSWELPLVCASVFVVVLTVAVFAWTMLHAIREYRPHPETTRLALFLVVAALSIVELHHVCTGRLRGWMAWAILVGNVWGFLDAALRFPTFHDVSTFFTLKQCLLLTVKVVCLLCGFGERSFENAMWFLVLFDVNVFFPLLYVMALPDGGAVERRLAAHDVVNVDLALRVMELATCRQRRLDSYSTLKRRVWRTAVDIAECSPLAEKAVNFSFGLPSSPRARSTRESRCV
jgi:hypothetical protein